MTFWTTWCGPYKRELPILEKAQREVGKDRLTVLVVNVGESSEAHAQIKKLMKTWEISLLSDPRSQISRSYGIKAIPHMFLLDREGEIIANHTRYGDKASMSFATTLTLR